MYSRKIILKENGSNNNSGNSNCSTDTNSSQTIEDKIYAAGIGNTCHTVTHVTQTIPVHFSKEDLDFILLHMSEPKWPRTVSTKATDGRQVVVNSKEEAFAYFKAANYLDCRISAYPFWRPSTLSDFVGIKNAIPPNFIMIDLDLSNFNDEVNAATTTNRVLRKTLKRINHLLCVTPTIIWSGNGYHIYIPISAVILEDIKEFVNIEQASTKFMRFAEWYLSLGKSDPAHNSTVSLNNCMLRVPGTYNSKNNTMVKIIIKWDNRRPKITLLLGSFCAYLKDKRLKEQRLLQQNAVTTTLSVAKNILWIDRLLQIAISNGRKYCIWRILVPYLVNRKCMSAEQSTIIITDWLNRCARLAKLNFNSNSRIDYAIRHVGKYGPVHQEMVRKEHNTLYEMLKVQGVL
ncbi:MAG: hypothetical protein WA941_16675 [Nitrososphaeraceae archaeon]